MVAYFVILYSINNKGNNVMQKTHINSLRNLLSKYNKEEILANIDKLNFDLEQIELKEKIFATDETALEWFENFCSQYNLTLIDGRPDPKKYNRLTVKGWAHNDKPYFMLWLNDEGPHVELGSSYYDLWGSTGMADLETKMHKICAMNKDLEIA
tara:strand:+ start:325 stop:786 length:462 start_codon:yes stop_codon:yes gene_type:complete